MNGSGTRSLTALYVAAPFSMGYVDFYTFLMPLYALSLGFDAAEVGILAGPRWTSRQWTDAVKAPRPSHGPEDHRREQWVIGWS